MKLIYIGDPMCSWCYGFGKELSEVMESRSDLTLEIVVGGVRAGATDLLDEAGKQFRLEHWARVEKASGLPFNRDAFSARTNFIYDTEPICRAVVTARTIAPEAPILSIFRDLQHAFYVEGLDTTRGEVLAYVVAHALARVGHYISADAVLKVFEASGTIAATHADFTKARQWGVSSFPSLVADIDGQLHQVSPGYASARALLQRLQELDNESVRLTKEI